MIKLLRNQIAVEPIYDSDYYNPSSQLIQIPETAKERCDQGIVKYKGPECVEESIDIGSHVSFSGYTGTNISVDGEILIILHENFVKCIFDIDNYNVPGLYFKGKVDSATLRFDILNKISSVIRWEEEDIQDIMRVFAKYSTDLLIPATYEATFPLLSSAYKDKYGKRITIKREEHKEQFDKFDETPR